MLLKEKDTRLDPRVKRTRKLLQSAFQALMAEKDFQDITVQDITERAELNRATFYAHFEDKYALLSFSVREALQMKLDRRMQDSNTFSLNNLRLLIITVSEFLSQFFLHCFPGAPTKSEDMIIGAQVQHHVYEMLLDWFQHGETRLKKGPVSPAHAARILSWTILGTVLE